MSGNQPRSIIEMVVIERIIAYKSINEVCLININAIIFCIQINKAILGKVFLFAGHNREWRLNAIKRKCKFKSL